MYIGTLGHVLVHTHNEGTHTKFNTNMYHAET